MSAKRRRHKGNTDSRRYYDWLDRAGEDLICAQRLIQDDFTYNSTAFHCQQTIEKALKAYILFRSNRLVDGHNLTWLLRQAARYNSHYNDWLKVTAKLNRAYIEARYPADIPLELGYQEIHNCYEVTKEIYGYICNEVDESLESHREKPEKK